jgi:hypothetical protein
MKSFFVNESRKNKRIIYIRLPKGFDAQLSLPKDSPLIGDTICKAEKEKLQNKDAK